MLKAMKLLCPTDFSYTSVDACLWAAHLLNSVDGGELELLHCVNVVSRSSMFVNVDDIFLEKAKTDLRELSGELKAIAKKVEIKATVVKNDPKTFIADYTKDKNYDFIVLGTQGLTALKDMTIGSVTAYLIDHTTIPIFVIPQHTTFKTLKTLVLGVDDKINREEILAPLGNLIKATHAKLEVVHTTEDEDLTMDYNSYMNVPLSGLTYNFTTIPQGESIPAALTEFSVDIKADLLVMVHRHRSWFQRLLNNSLTKKGLFFIKLPLLLLPHE
jgi:nucleotide-binding universal stress UspA family protein